jgi:hypothetical protein
MLSKLAISAFVVASLLGTTAVASAQTPPAAGASADANAMSSNMRHHRMKSHHVRYSRARMDKSRPGGRPVSRKQPGN